MGAAIGFGSPDVARGAVTEQGFCSRLCQSLVGVAVGFVLVLGAIGLIGWNEFNYVRNDKIIRRVQQDTYIYQDCTPNPSKDGQAVYASCPLSSLNDFAANQFKGRLKFTDEASPTGKLFGVWFKASSDIFQWRERSECTEETTTGGTKKKTCNYYYEQAWVSAPISSDSFYCISGGRTMQSPGCPGYRREPTVNPVNRGAIPVLLQGTVLPNDFTVAMGSGFTLNRQLFANGIFGGRDVGLDAKTSSPPEGIDPAKKVFFKDGVAYFATNEPTTTAATVGDVRSRFTVSNVRADGSTFISVVARQQGAPRIELAPWSTGMAGTMSEVNWASAGKVPLDKMITDKKGENSSMTMLLRFVGWLVMFVGLQLITGPIALAPEIVPCIGGFLGEVVGCALCCMNFAISISWSLVIIGVAWVLARPLVGLGILVLAALLFGAGFLVRQRFAKGRSALHGGIGMSPMV